MFFENLWRWVGVHIRKHFSIYIYVYIYMIVISIYDIELVFVCFLGEFLAGGRDAYSEAFLHRYMYMYIYMIVISIYDIELVFL